MNIELFKLAKDATDLAREWQNRTDEQKQKYKRRHKVYRGREEIFENLPTDPFCLMDMIKDGVYDESEIEWAILDSYME